MCVCVCACACAYAYVIEYIRLITLWVCAMIKEFYVSIVCMFIFMYQDVYLGMIKCCACFSLPIYVHVRV